MTEHVTGALAATLLAAVIVLAATIVFDLVHVALHRLARARSPWLRAVGDLHGVHHRFLGRDLQVEEDLVGANLRHHVIPEYGTHVVFTASLLLVLPTAPVVVALALETLVFVVILRDRGLDVNHRPRERVPAYLPTVFCVPAYHALHHVWPDAFYSSWIKVLDWVLGSAAQIRGRRVGIIGADTALVQALASRLASETGTPAARLQPTPTSQLDTHDIEQVDLLVLMPRPDTILERGSEWIEQAILAAAGRLVPIEVWVVVDTPTAFAAEGRGYAVDARVIYRHVVVPRALERDRSAGAARTIVRRVRRGAHWIDVASPWRMLRDFLGGWRAARPVLRGPRVSALA